MQNGFAKIGEVPHGLGHQTQLSSQVSGPLFGLAFNCDV
jgi:hypothetical protein